MAEECTASSSPLPPPTWWDPHSLSSWTSITTSSPWHQQNPSSNSSGEEDVLSISNSLTNVSNHSALTAESAAQLVKPASSTGFMGEHAPNCHLWRGVLQSAGNNGDLKALSCRSTISSSEIFEPAACDYLNKIDSNNWEFNHFERNLNGLNESLLNPKGCNMNISLSYAIEQTSQQQQLCDGSTSRYGTVQDRDMQAPFLPIMMELDSKCMYELPLSTMTRRPLIDLRACKRPFLKPLSLSSDCTKQIPSPMHTIIPERTQGITNEGKKKRSEETPETVMKKPKLESSTVSSVKAAKVKLGDRITALQQIVSPFGKTDTASVLLEAIGYIRFLQEQVQLLSNPNMKINPHKDPWGSLGRKDRGDMKLDLKSRGLCLVPISCTPQIYRENSVSDYWTPTYRGCLYR
ncbi:hypothetical protein SLA2020_216450 [Shorea laevis]